MGGRGSRSVLRNPFTLAAAVLVTGAFVGVVIFIAFAPGVDQSLGGRLTGCLVLTACAHFGWRMAGHRSGGADGRIAVRVATLLRALGALAQARIRQRIGRPHARCCRSPAHSGIRLLILGAGSPQRRLERRTSRSAHRSCTPASGLWSQRRCCRWAVQFRAAATPRRVFPCSARGLVRVARRWSAGLTPGISAVLRGVPAMAHPAQPAVLPRFT